MKRNWFFAGLLSLLFPGLGQIYLGKGDKGAIIIAAAVVIENLNVIILPLIAMTNPSLPVVTSGALLTEAAGIPALTIPTGAWVSIFQRFSWRAS